VKLRLGGIGVGHGSSLAQVGADAKNADRSRKAANPTDTPFIQKSFTQVNKGDIALPAFGEMRSG
jgi:hypothetical protein